jgi:hypothetical protein
LALGVTSARAMTGKERLVTDHGTYTVGESIKIGFTNGPANATDWIAIYKAGEVPGQVSSTKYLYVGGGGSAGAALSSGEVTFIGGLSTAGDYVAYFLEKDGYRVLAQDAFSVVASTAPQVRADKQFYAKGEKITVTFAHGPGNAKDWIGIYHEGVVPAPSATLMKYVDNTATGDTGVTDGTVTFDTGLAMPGKWVVYLFPNDDFTPVAQDSFEVILTGSGIVTITPDHHHYMPSQPVRFTFDGGPGHTTDWIGVYKAGQTPGPTPSTDWRYVGGTQNPGAGLTSGEIVLDGGFSGPQLWTSYFMINDGYTITGGERVFETVDAAAPIVETSKLVYEPNAAVTLSFTNAPGNAKDWLAIYPKGVDPSKATATLWNYLDGTHTGATAGITEGEMTFAAGLNAQDIYTAYLFQDDTYTVLAQEDFTVKASGILPVRITSVSPDDQGSAGPSPDLRLVFENRDTSLNQSTLSVKLDGTDIAKNVVVNGNFITVTTTVNQVFAAGSQHTYTISYKDSAGTDNATTVHFTISPYQTIMLSPPLFLETFDSTAEGSLPAGWTASNSSGEVLDANGQTIPADMHHLGSLAYNNFVVVDSARLGGDFLTYGDSTPEAAPLAQILGPTSVPVVVNGSTVRTFANGKILLGLSSYHGAGNEILEVTTPDYNLSGKQNIYLSFHSLLEQNQDSIEGIEVSNDAGATWHPVVYYLDPADIVSVNNVVDADQTFNTTHTDVAMFPDGSGGTYGAFLKAPLGATAAAHIQPRGNDDPADGTRVEYIRVPEADNQAAVKFRIFYAGTDSWYLGIDDFGLYQQPIVDPPIVKINSIVANGSSVTVNYTAGGILESSLSVGPGAQWSTVAGASNGSYTTTMDGAMRFFRVRAP